MSKVAKGFKAIFSGGAASQSSGVAEMAASQAEQRAQTEADSRRLSAIEQGAARVRRGGTGLAGYLDEKLSALFGG